MQIFESSPKETDSNNISENTHTESLPQAMSQEPENSSEPPPTRGFAPVLNNKRFLNLWLGQVFSQLADKVYLVLTIALISSKFQNPDSNFSGWVSAIMIAFTVPAVLFGSLAGVYVDRWSKKSVLVISNLLRGILVLAIPLLLWLSQGKAFFFYLPLGFWILLGITFAVSTLTQFFAPAEQAVIPLIVNRRNLLPANSLYTTTMMASSIVGFAVGEPLLKLADTIGFSLGLTWDIGKEFIVGGAYVIAGLLLLFLKTEEKPEDLKKERPHVFEDIRDGIAYLGNNHRVRNALIQLVILFSVFAALTVLAVPLAKNLDLKPEQFGFFLAAGGIGMGIGAATLGGWGQKFSNLKLGFWGSIGVAFSLIGLAIFTRNLWMALTMTALLGAFGALVSVPMQTTIQAETPADMRGKVFGLQNNAVNIALSLPLALAGIAETYFGLKAVFMGLALLSSLGTVLTWYIYRQNKVKLNKVNK
jgi:predicted MFS family arabinose efflux permease